MSYILKDFSDIVSAIMEELKIQSGDTVSKNRIKRDINQVYIDEVVPQKRWLWLSGHTLLEHKPYYGVGTASVTPASATVTLSIPPSVGAGSKSRYYFAVTGFDEIYVISSHTAGSATVTLSSPYTGAVNATATYKIWTDSILLPTDLAETVEVWHDYSTANMEAVGLQEFRRISKENPRSESRPYYYTTYDFQDPTPDDAEAESDRYRLLKIWPAVNPNSTTVHIDYKKEAVALDLDGDEPLMPIEDRIVLVYGALHRAWSRERNPNEAQRNFQLFQNKLARMAGKVEDSVDKPQLIPDNRYILEKRGRRLGRYKQGGPTGGGSSYTSPTYIADATIATGNTLTGDLTVTDGILIDGRDLSEDGIILDALSLNAGEILVGSVANVPAAVTPSGDVTITYAGVTSISANVIVDGDISVSAAIAYGKLDLADEIVDADINSAAAIAYSKLDLTDSIVDADIDSAAAIAYSKLALTGEIVDADIDAAAAIAYSKLALTSSIVDADINASAAIAYSKLNLTSSIVNTDIGAAAAIDFSKLATLTSGNILVGSAGNVATSVAVSGDISLSNAGVTAIGSGVIVDADINASAAIAFSKLATLSSANILVGSAGNVATSTAVSGDISLSNAGVTAYVGTLPLNKGGTGQTTKAPAFDALSPMSASGDIIYGGASGTGTRLVKGTDTHVLTLASGVPTWAAPSGSANFAEYMFQGGNGNGSGSTFIRKMSNATISTDASSLLTVINDSTLGITVTVNRPCIIHISYSDMFSAGAALGITKNEAELTTSLYSFSDHTKVLAIAETNGAGYTSSCSASGYATTNDVFRPHNSAATNGGNPERSVFYVSAKEI